MAASDLLIVSFIGSFLGGIAGLVAIALWLHNEEE